MMYDPDGKISIRALILLEVQGQAQVLETLETRLPKLKEKAGFSITKKFLPMNELYTDTPAACKHIFNWVEDKSPRVSPTWCNFFKILRELGVKPRKDADRIEKYLKSTTVTRKYHGKLYLPCIKRFSVCMRMVQ